MEPTAQPQKQKPLLLIIATYVILLLVIVIGIYLIKSSTNSQTQLASCQYDAQVCTFLETLANPSKYYPGPFTASILTTKPDTTQSRVIIRSNGKDSVDVISYKENILAGESIIIGNTVYIKNLANQTWIKSGAKPDALLENFKQKSLSEVNRTGTDVTYTFLGTASCGKNTCIKYQVKSPKQQTAQEYILFDETSHILRAAMTKTTNNTTTETLFLYTPVTITPPVTK